MAAKIPPAARAYLAEIGRRGGKNGRGKPKRRPEGFYAEIGKKGGKAKRSVP